MIKTLSMMFGEVGIIVNWWDVLVTVVFFSVVLLCWYQAMCSYFTQTSKDGQGPSQKQKAWFLSFFISCLSTPLGVYYLSRALSPDWDASEMLDTDAFSRSVLTLFWVYLIVDMAVGYFEYPGEFGLLSGWVHHIFYALFLGYAYMKGYSISFTHTLIMESSSIFLSGGRLFPRLRSDWAFGCLFLLFRVVYHLYLLLKLYSLPAPRGALWPPVAGVWVLHLYWFRGWMQGMRRRAQQSKTGEASSSMAFPCGDSRDPEGEPVKREKSA